MPTHPKGFVLIYTGTARAFRTTLIGYVSEVSRKYSTVLLTEALDQRARDLLRDKSLFPRLERIIDVNQYATSEAGSWRRGIRLRKLAHSLVAEFRPRIVIATSDNDSIFEMYLMRFARRQRAFTISISCVLTYPDVKAVRTYIDTVNLHSRTPKIFPSIIRRGLIVARKWSGHIWIYWLMPFLQGQWPFWGFTSYILQIGHNGMRDAKVQVVMDRRDLVTYARRGVSSERLVCISHPIVREMRPVFQALFASDHPLPHSEGRKIALFLLPENDFSLREGSMEVISPAAVMKRRLELLRVAQDTLPQWQIVIKPHPNCAFLASFKRHAAAVGLQIGFLEPASEVESWIAKADLIIELPKSGSMALLLAMLYRPELPIVAVSCDQEFFADYFRGHPGIEFVLSLDAYRIILKQVANGTYRKPIPAESAVNMTQAGLLETVTHLHPTTGPS